MALARLNYMYINYNQLWLMGYSHSLLSIETHDQPLFSFPYLRNYVLKRYGLAASAGKLFLFSRVLVLVLLFSDICIEYKNQFNSEIANVSLLHVARSSVLQPSHSTFAP